MLIFFTFYLFYLQNNFEFANAQVTDRSELSTDRSDYNGSMGYYEADPPGLGDISPRGMSGNIPSLPGNVPGTIGMYPGSDSSPRGGGGTSPHPRLVSWAGESPGGLLPPAFSDGLGVSPGSNGVIGGGTGESRIIFGSRFQPHGSDLTALTGNFSEGGSGLEGK